MPVCRQHRQIRASMRSTSGLACREMLAYHGGQIILAFLPGIVNSKSRGEAGGQTAGKSMEYFDIVDINGVPTGQTVSRADAHRDGIRHRTAHVWVTRRTARGWDVLLQKRSLEKDSFPGLYDTSSAGHIPAGDDPLPSALRELREELGIAAAPEDLRYAGTFRIQYEEEFHGRPFRDNEITWVYVYDAPVDVGALTLQASEVEEVRWFDLDEVWGEIKTDRSRFCVPAGGLALLREYLGRLA